MGFNLGAYVCVITNTALILVTSLLTTTSAFAASESPQVFTYQGRMMDATGTAPVTGTVPITLTILDPSGNCTLYEENQGSVDLGTTGLFAIQVGSALLDAKRTVNDPGLTMAQVFANPIGSGVLVPNGPNCSSGGGYTPAAGDQRLLKVNVNGTVLSPNLAISAVPQALVAETLQGIGPAGFAQIAGNVTQGNLNTLTGAGDASALHHHNTYNDARYARIGTATAQDFGSSNITTTGKIGIGTASPNANFEIKDASPALRMTATGGTSSSIDFYSNTGSTTRASIKGSDAANTLTFYTGGSQAMQIDASQNAIFAASLSTAGTVGLGKYTTVQEGDAVTAGTLIFSLNALGATAKGTMWVNSTTNMIRYWDGSAAQSVASASAYLALAGGTMTGTINGRASTIAAGTSPIKLPTGVLMTAPEAGAIEYDGTNLYFTDSGAARRTIATTTAGDNLGNHTATQALQMDGFAINGSTASGGDMTIDSTIHATKGDIYLNPTGGKVGVGTVVPGAMLDVGTAGSTLGTMRLEGSTSGYVQIQPAVAAGSWTWTLPADDGTNGQVLSTNGSGVTSWVNASGGADNMGDHTATTNIQLGTNWLSGDGGNEGVYVGSTGNVGIGNSSPGALLDVGVAGATLGVIRLEGNTSGYAALRPTAAAGDVTITLPATTGTVALTGNKLSAFAATTSAELAGVISDETGSGVLVFGTSPTLTTPVLGVARATSLDIGTAASVLGTLKLEGDTSGFVQIQPATAAGSWTWTLPPDDGTNGQVLSTNGSGVTTWVNASSGADNMGDHTATTNILLGTNWLSGDGGSEGVYVGSTGNVGIGNSSPGALLDVGVAGATLGVIRLEGNTSGYAALRPTAAAGDVTITLPATTGTVALTSSKLSGFAATTSAELAGVISDETGSGVLVFGTSPTLTTPVLGAATATSLDVGTAGSVLGTLKLEGNTSGFVQIQPAAAAGSWTWTLPADDGANGQVLSTNGSGVTSWTNAGVSSQWTTSGSDIYYNSGNVAIGTTGTYTSLDVTSSATLTLAPSMQAIGTSTNTTFANDYGVLQVVNTDQTANNWASILFSDGAALTNGAAAGLHVQYLDHTDNYADMAFGTRSAGGYTEKMRILSGGNIGIGNSAPGALLDVGKAGSTLGVIRLEGSTSGYAALQPTAAAGDVTITFPATTGTVALTASKLSGFAATTSAELAGVISDETGSGALVFGTSPTLTTPVLGVATATSLTSPSIIGGTGTTSTLTLKTTTGVGTTNADMIFQVGNNGATEAMRILNSGSVGIQNASPGALLDIGTAGTTKGTMRLEGNTSGYVQIQPLAAAGSWTWTLPADDGTNGQVLTTDGSGVTTWTTVSGADNMGDHTATTNILLGTNWLSGDGGSEGVYVGSTGNVGIANSSPGALLDVGVAGATLGVIRLEGNTSGYAALRPTAAAGDVTITLPATTGTVALTGNKLSTFAATTSAELAGVISDETGSGALVFGTSPTLTTPVLGAATGTSLDLGTAGSVLGVLKLEGSTSGFAQIQPTAAAGNVTITLPATTGTVALTASKLSGFAATTSAELAGVISDETGSGALVFGTSPTLTTPVLGVATATSITAPAITGGTGTTSTLTLKTTTGVGTTNADMIFQVGNNGATEAMRILNSGSVGIQNASPGALLDIGTAGTTKGTMRLEGNTSGYVQIQPAAAAGSWTWTLPADDGTNGQVLTTDGSGVTSWASAGGSSQWTTTGSNIYYNTGSVGIGNTNPAFATLQVTGSGSTTVYVDASAGTTGVYGLGGTTGVKGEGGAGGFGVYGLNNTGIAVRGVTASSGTAGYFTSTSGYGLIVDTGKVGFGDTTPDTTLKVTGSLCVKSDGNNCAGSTAGTIYAGNTTVQSADYAEYFLSETKLEKGEIVGLNPATGLARGYQFGDKLLGVVSTNPGVVGNSDIQDQLSVLVALMGQVPFRANQTKTEDGLVKTLDGKPLGYLLSNGNVYVNISSTNYEKEILALKSENENKDRKIQSLEERLTNLEKAFMQVQKTK